MPQTLLALLALVLASFLTFNQQRLTIRSQSGMVDSELELAAAGVASEVMAYIEGRSFDERTTPEKIKAASGVVPESPSSFSSASSFGYSGECNLMHPGDTPSCDDVDDLAGQDWMPVTIELARQLVLDPGTGDYVPDPDEARQLAFEVRTDVYYVDTADSMDPADHPTLHKRVLMDIRSPHSTGRDEGMMRVTRVISYDPIKADMDYENSDIYNSGSGVAQQN